MIYKIHDICDLIAGFAFKSKDFGNYSDKVIKIADIQPPIVNMESTVGVDTRQYDINKLQKFIVAKGDYVLAMTGATIGKLGRITSDCKAYINQRVLTFRPNEQIVNKDYLYYSLCSNNFTKYILNHIDSETAQPNISAGSVGGFEISLPSLGEQRRIVDILIAIDRKIEINKRINDNLEQQAQALYKSWFIDNYQTEWPEYSLDEVTLKITDGVHNTVIDTPNGEYYLLSCKNIKNRRLNMSSSDRRIDEGTFNKLRKRTMLSKGDILLSSVGTIGELMLLNDDPHNYEFQRSVAIIKPNPVYISSYYLYENLISQIDKITNTAHGAVQQCIFLSDLKEYTINIADKALISRYDIIVKPFFDEITKREKEIAGLTSLRDSLLPKLMSGELKINNLDC